MSNSEQELIARIHQETMPFKSDPPYAVDFYTATGRMVLLWGRLEQYLDDLLLHAIVIAKKKDGKLYTMQIALGRKLTLLKTICKDCRALHPIRPSVTKMAIDMKKNSKKRNMIIHANWSGFKDSTPPRLKMRHLSHTDTHVHVTELEPSLSDIAQMADNFHLCTSQILSILKSTVEIAKTA